MSKTKYRNYRSGAIEERGTNSYRLSYRVNGLVYRRAFKGTRKEADKVLRDLLSAADKGEHVAPDKLTLRAWCEHWLSVRPISQRSRERYAELLRLHDLPTLGDRPLQQIEAAEIDRLYADLKSSATARFVHIVFKACLADAERKGKIARSPMYAADAPRSDEGDHGVALEAHQLRALVQGFRSSSLFPIVAVAAFTGARRGEILGLQWSDLDLANKTLRIERSVDWTRAHGVRIKGTKTERSKRTITIGDDLIALLLAERERHLRIVAGVPDGVSVDLSLVKLPPDALMFPNPPARGEDFSFTALRNPKLVTDQFARKAVKLGFTVRFHDLRGSVATLLLNAGQPVHAVAARLGHSPAILLKAYAKRTRSADTAAAAVMDNLARGMLS
jgi:integrase